MKSRKLIAVVMLAVSICTINPTVVRADENSVKEAQAKYQEYQDKIDEANSHIYSLNSSIEELVVSIKENEDKVTETENEIKFNKLKIEELKEDIDSREKLKASRLREMYKSNIAMNYMSLVLSVRNFSDLVSVIDGFSTLMEMDRSVILGLEDAKDELNDKVKDLSTKEKELNLYSRRLNSDKESLEIKVNQQEEIIASLESEKAKFGSEVLEVAERELVAYQIETINSSSSASELSSMVNQLNSIKDGQLTMPNVIEEVTSAVDSASSKIEDIRQQELAYNTTQVNRGPGFEASTGNSIVDFAFQFLGRPYVWGAVGPDTFDCSGLTSYVYRHAAGIEITRTTYTQINVGTPVSYSEMQPGDLVFTYDNEHVGIYVGNGMYINATFPGSTVRVTPVTNFYAARRIL